MDWQQYSSKCENHPSPNHWKSYGKATSTEEPPTINYQNKSSHLNLQIRSSWKLQKCCPHINHVKHSNRKKLHDYLEDKNLYNSSQHGFSCPTVQKFYKKENLSEENWQIRVKYVTLRGIFSIRIYLSDAAIPDLPLKPFRVAKNFKKYLRRLVNCSIILTRTDPSSGNVSQYALTINFF